MSYEQDRADFEYLERIAEVEDMVTIDASVFDLMRNPFKATAAIMYRSCIRLWFQEHEEKYCGDNRVAELFARHWA